MAETIFSQFDTQITGYFPSYESWAKKFQAFGYDSECNGMAKVIGTTDQATWCSRQPLQCLFSEPTTEPGSKIPFSQHANSYEHDS